MSATGAYPNYSGDPEAPLEICLVGVGPRGLSVLERLCANAGESPRRDIRVRLVDPRLGVGGRVWRTDQSGHLLMNTVASQVTLFADDSVECAGPVVHGPSLYQWARVVVLFDPFHDFPDPVREEAAALGPDSYPTRAFYGHYLTWVLRHLITHAPANLLISRHPEQAVDLVDEDGGTQTAILASGTRLTGLHAVVLALGHVGVAPTPAQRRRQVHAARRGLRYVTPDNPADVDLGDVGGGEPVILRGMGLNFFDHLALLTSGRGGLFRHDENGRLRYERSGDEPHVIAGSRRGVPYHARGENQKGATGRHVPLFLTPRRIAALRASGPLQFRTDIWPWIDREVRAVYYATIVGNRSGDAERARFLREFRAGVESSPDTGGPGDELLRGFGFGATPRWDWQTVATPCRDRTFRTPGAFRDWLLAYLDADVREARLGNVRGPIKAALDVLRDLRNEVRLLVDHGGITGDSYRDDLDDWYTPLNAFLSIGPPARRIEEAAALIEAGVLTVVGPRVVVDLEGDRRGFLIRSPSIPGAEYHARTLVEARLPEVDARRTTDLLLTRLLARGACALNRIPNRTAGAYETGGIAVTTRPYAVLDARGRPHPRRFAFGVPTETVHWATAAGVRPGVNSVILGDADALARQSLGLPAHAVTGATT
ncbi:FAD/NAD(P)-binding protein [Actinosynnema sp. NPDC051121]